MRTGLHEEQGSKDPRVGVAPGAIRHFHDTHELAKKYYYFEVLFHTFSTTGSVADIGKW